MIFEAIKKMVNSNHNKPLDHLISEKTNEIKEYLDGAEVKVVKSIQRGTASIGSNVQQSVNVTINAINPNKAVVIINHGKNVWNISSTADVSEGAFPTLTETTLSFFLVGKYTYVDWQIIEFY